MIHFSLPFTLTPFLLNPVFFEVRPGNARGLAWRNGRLRISFLHLCHGKMADFVAPIFYSGASNLLPKDLHPSAPLLRSVRKSSRCIDTVHTAPRAHARKVTQKYTHIRKHIHKPMREGTHTYTYINTHTNIYALVYKQPKMDMQTLKASRISSMHNTR